MEIGPQSPGRDAYQPPVLARRHGRFDVLIGAERAHEQANLQQAVGAAGGIAHLSGLVQPKRQRGLAEDVLACVQRRYHEGVMDRARQADIDCVRRRNQRVAVVEGLGLADRSNGAGARRVTGEHADDRRFGDPGIGGGMRRSHGARAQDADPNLGQSSHPAPLTCSRNVLLTGTRSPLRNTRTLRPALRSTDPIAPSATHHERCT